MQVFTPSAKQYGRFALGIVPIVIIILVIDFYRLRDDPLFFALLTVIGFGLLGAFLFLYFRNTRVQASFHEVTTRNAFGRVRTYRADQLDRTVILRDYVQFSYSSPSRSARLMVLDSAGHVALNWWSQWWTNEDMASLASTLQLPIEDIREQISSTELRKRYPHAVSWAVAHPRLFPWLIAVPAVVILIVVIVIVVGP